MSSELPSNSESELAVIGCCLLGGLETTIQAIELIPNGSVFMREDCGKAMALLETMATQNRAIGQITLLQEWGKFYPNETVPEDILQSVAKTPSALNLDWYVKDIANCARRRQLIYAGDDLMKKAQNPSVDVDALVTEIERKIQKDDGLIDRVSDATDCTMILTDALEKRFELQGRRSGLVTGLLDFDEMTDGLQKGEMTIIGGRPSGGKSALGMNIAEQVCFVDNRPTLFVSLEMSKRSLLMRLMSSVSRFRLKDLRRGLFTETDFRKFTTFMAQMKSKPFWILDTLSDATKSCSKLCATIRSLCRQHSIELVVIDYLQKIPPAVKGEKRTYEVGSVSTALKDLAVQTDAAFLVLAQLSREPDRDKGRKPRISDLADSSQIERDADLIALIHREMVESGGANADLIIGKQRDGETGLVKLTFRKEFCRFENASRSNDPDPEPRHNYKPTSSDA